MYKGLTIKSMIWHLINYWQLHRCTQAQYTGKYSIYYIGNIVNASIYIIKYIPLQCIVWLGSQRITIQIYVLAHNKLLVSI